jgi:hypothetical protein
MAPNETNKMVSSPIPITFFEEAYSNNVPKFYELIVQVNAVTSSRNLIAL